MSDIWGNINEHTILLPHEQAEWADIAHLARYVLDTVGDDHSIDGVPLWEASWELDECNASLTLTKESDGEGNMDYWLLVDQGEGHRAWSYCINAVVDFDLVAIGLVFEEGEEEGEDIRPVAYSSGHPEFAAHAQNLRNLLGSAPVDVSQAPHDELWDAMFEEIIANMKVQEARERKA